MATKSLVRVLAAALTVPLVATAFSTTAWAARVKPPTSKPVYVALGDSYAAGTGAGSYLSDGTDCHRSTKGYPYLIASAGGYALNYQACSGADIADVTNLQLGALTPKTTPAPSVVTITVGGNDVGFADTMTTCIGTNEAACLAAVGAAEGAILDTNSEGNLGDRLGILFGQVSSMAPNAKIVATAYPKLLSEARPDCSVLTSLTLTEVQALNGAALKLATLIKTEAEDARIGYAEVQTKFTGYEVCTGTPWINNVRFLSQYESFHPNASGYLYGYKPVVTTALKSPTTSTSPLTVTTGGKTSSDTTRGTVKVKG